MIESLILKIYLKNILIKWSNGTRLLQRRSNTRKYIECLRNNIKYLNLFLTQDTIERIERALMQSLHETKEIFISYYRDGFIHDEYITVIDIDKQSNTVHYTDAFGLQTRLKFEEFVDIK